MNQSIYQPSCSITKPPLRFMSSMCETLGIFKYATFNVPALCRLVSKLRGQSCICDTSQVPACGSFNWTIPVSFLDGVEWVLRPPEMMGQSRLMTRTSCCCQVKSQRSSTSRPTALFLFLRFGYTGKPKQFLFWMMLMITQLF